MASNRRCAPRQTTKARTRTCSPRRLCRKRERVPGQASGFAEDAGEIAGFVLSRGQSQLLSRIWLVRRGDDGRMRRGDVGRMRRGDAGRMRQYCKGRCAGNFRQQQRMRRRSGDHTAILQRSARGGFSATTAHGAALWDHVATMHRAARGGISATILQSVARRFGAARVMRGSKLDPDPLAHSWRRSMPAEIT